MCALLYVCWGGGGGLQSHTRVGVLIESLTKGNRKCLIHKVFLTVFISYKFHKNRNQFLKMIYLTNYLT